MNSTTSPSKFPTPLAGGASTPKAATALGQDPSLVASQPGKVLPQRATKIGVWTRVSSFSFATLILAAAPSHAAGVCIVCPPGHTCPAGGGPIVNTGAARLATMGDLTGLAPISSIPTTAAQVRARPDNWMPSFSDIVPGGNDRQILQRTTTGTQWVNILQVMASFRDECNELRLTMPPDYVLGLCEDRFCYCSIHTGPWRNLAPLCPNNPFRIHTFPVFEGPTGCTAGNEMGCLYRCLTDTRWRTS